MTFSLHEKTKALFLHVFSLIRTEELQELRKLRQDNDSLERQVDVLKGQSVLADNGKKRAEDRLRKKNKTKLQRARFNIRVRTTVS